MRADRFDPAGLVSEVARLLVPRAAEKKLELCVHVPADLPQAVVGDSPRLRQVLLNLVGNAIKFTEAGHVRATIRYRAADGFITVAVAASVSRPTSSTSFSPPSSARMRSRRATSRAPGLALRSASASCGLWAGRSRWKACPAQAPPSRCVCPSPWPSPWCRTRPAPTSPASAWRCYAAHPRDGAARESSAGPDCGAHGPCAGRIPERVLRCRDERVPDQARLARGRRASHRRPGTRADG
jgi:hypothetical protein